MRKGKAKGKFSTISLPVQLLERLKKKIEKTGFTSLSSYIEFLARTIIEEDKDSKGRKKSGIIETDKEKVKARLRALGYID